MENGCRQSQLVSASSLDIPCRWLGVSRSGGKPEASASAVFPHTRGKENLPLSHSQRNGVGRESPPPAQLVYLNEAHPLLRSKFPAWRAGMKLSAKNRLIDVYFAVPDFYIVVTIRAGTHPGLVGNRGPPTTEVRQRHQIPLSAFLDCWKRRGFKFTLTQ